MTDKRESQPAAGTAGEARHPQSPIPPVELQSPTADRRSDACVGSPGPDGSESGCGEVKPGKAVTSGAGVLSLGDGGSDQDGGGVKSDKGLEPDSRIV